MRHLIFILVLICIQLGNAQIDFEKGYFIDNQGNKKECFIKNLDWKNNPTDFEYKYAPENEASILGEIKTISEFGIFGKVKFKRFDLKIDRSKSDINNLRRDRNPQWLNETLFLKVLIEGKATLFSYYDGDLYKYFYSIDGSNPEQLIFIKYLKENDVFAENSYYKYQLETKLKSSKINQKDIESLRYEKKDLEKLFLKYNESQNANVIIYQKEKKDNFNLKLTTSLNFTSLDIIDPSTGFNSSTDMSSKQVYSFGVELEYYLPYNNGKWGLFINPSFFKYENQKSYYGSNGALYLKEDVLYETKVEASNIEIPIGARYHFFFNKNSKLFLSSAYVFNLGKAKYEFNIKGKFDSNIRNNIAFGLGYVFANKYSLEYRYHTSTEFLGGYWSSKYHSQGFVLSYNFL